MSCENGDIASEISGIRRIMKEMEMNLNSIKEDIAHIKVLLSNNGSVSQDHNGFCRGCTPDLPDDLRQINLNLDLCTQYLACSDFHTFIDGITEKQFLEIGRTLQEYSEQESADQAIAAWYEKYEEKIAPVCNKS